MNDVERMWAGWRAAYVTEGDSRGGCVFCELLASGLPDSETNLVWRDDTTAVFLNAYPYGSGHVLVMPVRHFGDIDDLTDEEQISLWQTIRKTVRALERAYGAPGMNIGFNLGAAAGAGIPAHLHAHVLPRWNADTNFMTAVANTRVLPEALSTTWEKLRAAWDEV